MRWLYHEPLPTEPEVKGSDMSDLVERLAEKRERFPRYAVIAGVDTEEARWWLNAIADELDQDKDDSSAQTAHWLRAQASTGESDE